MRTLREPTVGGGDSAPRTWRPTLWKCIWSKSAFLRDKSPRKSRLAPMNALSVSRISGRTSRCVIPSVNQIPPWSPPRPVICLGHNLARSVIRQVHFCILSLEKNWDRKKKHPQHVITGERIIWWWDNPHNTIGPRSDFHICIFTSRKKSQQWGSFLKTLWLVSERYLSNEVPSKNKHTNWEDSFSILNSSVNKVRFLI